MPLPSPPPHTPKGSGSCPQTVGRVSTSSDALGGEGRACGGRIRVRGGIPSHPVSRQTPNQLPQGRGSPISHLKSPPGSGFNSPKVLSPRNKTCSRLVAEDPRRDTMTFPGPDGWGRWVWCTLTDRYRDRATAGAGADSGAGPLTLRAARVSVCVCVCVPLRAGGGVGTDRDGGGAFEGAERSLSSWAGRTVTLLVLRDVLATTWSAHRMGSGKPGALPTAWGRERGGSGQSEYSRNLSLRGVGRRMDWRFGGSPAPRGHPPLHTVDGWLWPNSPAPSLPGRPS